MNTKTKLMVALICCAFASGLTGTYRRWTYRAEIPPVKVSVPQVDDYRVVMPISVSMTLAETSYTTTFTQQMPVTVAGVTTQQFGLYLSVPTIAPSSQLLVGDGTNTSAATCGSPACLEAVRKFNASHP
jgi:hypothetical protein